MVASLRRERHADLLWYYTRFATARDHILPDGTLRLNAFATMRDPRESRAWWPHIVQPRPRSVQVARNLQNRIRAEIDALRTRTYLLCLVRDDEPRHQEFPHQDRGYASPVMWEFYAEEHTGVCLGFNRDALVDTLTRALRAHGEIRWGDVHYSDRELMIDISSQDARSDTDIAESLFQEQASRLFFQKTRAWRHEREYRFAVMAPSPVGPGIPVSYDNSLRHVIVGTESAQQAGELLGPATPHGVTTIEILNWVNNQPRLDRSTS